MKNENRELYENNNYGNDSNRIENRIENKSLAVRPSAKTVETDERHRRYRRHKRIKRMHSRVNRNNVVKSNLNIAVLLIMTLTLTVTLSTAIVKASSSNNTPTDSKFYTSVMIEEGDTLWSIAQEYCDNAADINDYIEELRSINHIEESRIQEGNYLIVTYTK